MSLGKVQSQRKNGRQPASHVTSVKEKRPRLEEEDVSILSGNLLREKPDAQLLQWLFRCHCAIRRAKPPFSVDEVFVEELLAPRCLGGSIAGVQQITGCLLSDLVRLHNGAVDSRPEVRLPFPRERADDVLTCLVAPFADVVRNGKSLKTCESLIERASVTRVFLHIIPFCKPPLEERLTYLFASVHNASGASAASSSNAVTTTTATEMARILSDVLQAAAGITKEQLAPLLRELASASPTLLRCTAASRARGGSGPDTAASLTSNEQPSRRSVGAVIAARILLGQVDVVPLAIADFVLDMVKGGVHILLSAKGTGDGKEEGCQGLRDVSRAMELFVALTELHVGLVCQLVPSLEPYLQHLHDEVRLVLVRGFFTAFGSHEAATRTYRSAFNTLLERFEDTAHVVRVEMLELSVEFVRSEATRSNTREGLPISSEIVPHVERCLVDANSTVRRAAVLAYGKIIITAPALVRNEHLQETLAVLVADKNGKVRQAAVEQLCIIYQKELYPWIPGAVLECLNSEGGVMLLETFFETMLPSHKGSREVASRGSTTDPTLHDGQRWKGASVPVFEFEKEAFQEDTYASSLARLCGDLNQEQFNLLLTFASKKAQVRLAVLRLFQLREEGRSVDIASSEGQEVANKAHRLLRFLVGISHAQHGEWNALFLAKDDKVSKAFINCCSLGVTRYATERKRLIRELEGRVDRHVLKFVRDSLLRQMMFALEKEDVEELVTRSSDLCRLDRESKSPRLLSELQCKATNILRALLFCCRSAPVFFPLCIGSLIELLTRAHNGPTAYATPSNVLLMLSFISEWANYICQCGEKELNNAVGGGESDFVTAIRSSGLLKILSTLCVRPDGPLIDDTTPVMRGKICKQAARCILTVVRIRGMEKLYRPGELVNSLVHNVRDSNSEVGFDAVCWLKALTVLIRDPSEQQALKGGSVVPAVANYLLVAVRDKTTASENAHVKAKCVELPSASVASATVDAAAKCLAALALNVPQGTDISTSVNETIDTLLTAYKLIGEFDPQSVGACLRRRSINQQLLKLVAHSSSTTERALAVAVVLSAESETVVRRIIQHKMSRHILSSRCDMRYVAFLMLTAISEETKNDYQQLRDILCKVGNHLRSKQAQTGATLSSREALTCFLEYSIPFLVLFMAHHTFFDSESENHFIAYQRVWHLLFDELFRQGAQCASFVMELLSRIKQTEDKLDGGGSQKSRLICDLGIRVMQECMGTRQINIEAIRHYPGSVQIPDFFMQSATASDALNTVYLDSHVLVTSHVPFRVPTASVSANSPGGDREGAVSPALTVVVGDDKRDGE